ncbi:6-hydroxyaminopurine reductase [Pragia fontium]|uniref:MOSC domain-containing protein YiiM n=1 Tax=Pragia fontium DSM 5563 = ATCC 49100 TaxID=1122977 RepID=A0AAJ5BI42_9GAMM|nr:6-hydroxyaminopurine reductase [Pragia fontium]AKJ43609.1 6-N-hydroxylaminopurine resistance protein [Pragia fontium]SFD20589.1 MOSC domain-containing protein YiiM [Pragia fontium DSM 5563 = ATCC 49100]SUB84104.1 6-N-hydroxylaminopurine resistance protein [Pragia fontium]VEJ56996.1 6-N-hydroxylaminopurine resistance protein [Pragia fontium]
MHYPNVYLGKIEPYEGHSPSAINKRAANGELTLTALGFEGDEQAETRHHGGADRALCHYPREHYAYWQAQYPEQAEQFVAPLFGENISTTGLNEENVYIGDIFRWGKALIQVTQPRSPCYKLNFHCDIGDFARTMQNSGRCGWLYRVISAGSVNSQQALELVSRNSDLSVAEAISIAFNAPFDAEQYRRMLAAAGLSASWSKNMQMRLLNRSIEDMERRLVGTQ